MKNKKGMMSMSIRAKIVVLFLISGFIILAGVITVSFTTQNEILQIEKKECKLGADNVKNFLKLQADSSANTSNTVTLWDEYWDAVKKNDVEWIKDNVFTCAKENSIMEFIITLDPKGKVVSEINSPESLKKLQRKSLPLYSFLRGDVHAASDIMKIDDGFYIVTIVPVVRTKDENFKDPYGYTLYGRKINKELIEQAETIMGLSIRMVGIDGTSVSTKGFIDTNIAKIKIGKVNSYQEKNKMIITYMDKLKGKLGTPIGNVFVQISSDRGIVASKNFVFGMSIVGVIILLVVVTIVIMINRIVIKPIRNVSMMMKDISEGEGDLTRQLIINTDDEMGELAQYFNAFVKKIRISIKEVSESMFVLKNTASNMAGISNVLADNSIGTSGKTSRASSMAREVSNGCKKMSEETASIENFISIVTSSVKDINQNVIELATATEQTTEEVENSYGLVQEITSRINTSADSAKVVSNSVNSVVRSVKELNLSLNEIGRNCNNSMTITQDAKRKAYETNEIIEQLNNLSKQIVKIVDVIRHIADQTNMLALNAAIEAAGAGEAGKGFAVVANEVKELAKKTGEATEEIGDQIGKMKVHMGKAVSSVSTITSVIDEINTINNTITSAVTEQSAILNEISNFTVGAAEKVGHITLDIEDVSLKAKAVSLSSEESARAVNSISCSTTELSTASEEVARDAQSAARKVKDISTKSHELSQQVLEILKFMESINESSAQVTAGAGNTSEVSKELAKLAENLERLISKFKV